MSIRFIRKTSILLTVILLAGGCDFGAGSSGNETKAHDEQSAAEKQITLTFWRNSGNTAENAAYDQLITAFMAKHPAIKIAMTPFPYSDYDTKLRTSVAAGNPPDIMAIDAPNLASYAQAGALLPLTDYYKQDGHLEDIPQTTIDGYTYQDNIFLAPLTESSIAMFYNRKMFEDAGIPFPSRNLDEAWTWEQVLDAAKRINDPAHGIYGIDPAQGFQNAGATAYFKYPIIWQFGGEVMNPEGTTARGYLDSPQTKKALQFYAGLFTDSKVASFEYPADAFPNRKLGITIDGTWSLTHFAENFPDFKLGVDFDVAPLPKGTRQAVANGSWALGISSQTKHAKEAWMFVNWVTSYEGLKLYSGITNDIPARYSVAKEIPELNEYPKNIFVQQNQKYGRPRPITPVFPQVSEAVRRLFEQVTLEKQDIDTAVREAINTIDQAYKDSQAQPAAD